MSVSDAQKEAIPKIVWQGNWEALSLSATERTLVATIDGRLSVGDLGTILALSAESIAESLQRLQTLGVVGVTAPSSPPRTSSGARAIAHDPAILSEDVDLSAEHKLRILDLFARIDSLDHYDILGVARDSDKKAIKRAYFDLAGQFHPDRFFRKRLGSYKLRMETIFARMTQAHDTLTKADKREAYDVYLRDHDRTRGIESMLANALAEAKRVEKAVLQGASDGAAVPDARPSSRDVRFGSEPPTTPSGTMPSAADLKARKDALAKRLLGQRAVPSASPSKPTLPAVSSAEAVESLRRRYEERVRAAKESNARRYGEHGTNALAQNDPVAAVNALRVAVTLDPNNEALRRSFDKAQAAADTILCEMYARQAKYEETSGNWVEAAKSWQKVTAARPGDAHAHDRAAAAIVKAGGDLHEAAKLAQVACTLEPGNANFKTQLASVYLAAGLSLNALRELQAALQLAPHDGTIQALLRRAGG